MAALETECGRLVALGATRVRRYEPAPPMEAGFIAVPLSAPPFGAHDERVLVPPGSIPITTSGKVRRSACAERYRQDEFTRLDTPA